MEDGYKLNISKKIGLKMKMENDKKSMMSIRIIKFLLKLNFLLGTIDVI